jgi:alpha-beta hydrolase superfamily lysophospholipase
LAHGWGANYGTLLRLAEPLVRSGYEVLLFDIRGHGRNDEVAYATVRHFRDDVMAVARYATEKFPGRPAVLLGHSLGGAAGVLAAAEGATLAGLGLLASPADVMEVTALYMSAKGLPGNLMVRLLRPFWWFRVRGTFGPLTPARRILEVKIPVLVVHPENDTRVPMAHAERMAAGAQTTVRVVEGARHTEFLGREETHAHVLAFLEQVEAEAVGD